MVPGIKNKPKSPKKGAEAPSLSGLPDSPRSIFFLFFNCFNFTPRPKAVVEMRIAQPSDYNGTGVAGVADA